MLVKRAPAKIMEPVKPSAKGKSDDWIKVIRKLRKDCSRIPSSIRDRGLIKLVKIRRRLGSRKTSKRRGCSL